MVDKNANKPLPCLSLCGAIGFALSVTVLAILEMTHTPDAHQTTQQARLINVMLCVLLASWSSIVSLITAWCPIILGGDRRPLFWVIPLLLGWIIFLQLFDWRSLIPQGR